MVTSLFDAAEGLARNDHPDTSKAAAKAIAMRSGTLRWKVLSAFVAAGPAFGSQLYTAEELERLTHLGGNTVRPRLVELRKAGLVEQTKYTAPTSSGRAACLWGITDAGVAALRMENEE